MTDYNDGKWHGWNGGECPVHPHSELVICTRGYGEQPAPRLAEDWDWSHEGRRSDLIAFRVIKPYRAPREWWLNVYDGRPGAVACQSKDEAEALGLGGARSVIRVREVTND